MYCRWRRLYPVLWNSEDAQGLIFFFWDKLLVGENKSCPCRVQVPNVTRFSTEISLCVVPSRKKKRLSGTSFWRSVHTNVSLIIFLCQAHHREVEHRDADDMILYLMLICAWTPSLRSYCHHASASCVFLLCHSADTGPMYCTTPIVLGPLAHPVLLSTQTKNLACSVLDSSVTTGYVSDVQAVAYIKFLQEPHLGCPSGPLAR
ncbi:hypothetical protein EDD17DRAFT_77779 [Pisolithus thermaeus]|nr:hypothetical protein EDD17DRAFT_77779 [Pisolithus thermaeus]